MGLSPEQIAGRMELEDAEHSVCAESIYRRVFIPTGPREGLCVIMAIGGVLALYSIPLGLRLGKVVKRDKTVFNLFVEPQYSISGRVPDLPKWQVYFALNMQFL